MIGGFIGAPIGAFISRLLTLFPALYSDADTIFAPTMAADQLLQPGLFTDADIFYTPGVTSSYAISAGLVDDTPDTFFAPEAGIANTLTPGLYLDVDTFFAPAIVAGAVTVSPGLFTDPDTFYTPDVGLGAILAPFFIDPDVIFSTNAHASYTVDAPLVTDVDTFYTPTLTALYTILPGLYTDIDTFFSPTVSPSAVAITVPLWDEADIFFAAIVDAGQITPDLIVDDDIFYPPILVREEVDAAGWHAEPASPGEGWTQEVAVMTNWTQEASL